MMRRRPMPDWLRGAVTGPYDKAELQRAYEAVRAGVPHADDRLVAAGTPLVAVWVRKFFHRLSVLDPEDLMQAGYLGLRIAAGRYDDSVSATSTFCSYAQWWIRAKIHRELDTQNCRGYALPADPRHDDKTLPQQERRYRYRRRGAMMEPVYDPPAPYSREDDPVQAAVDHDERACCLAALGKMHRDYRRVLELRYGVGVGDGVSHTLEDIARILTAEGRRCTRERVRQLEAKALPRYARLRGIAPPDRRAGKNCPSSRPGKASRLELASPGA